MTAPTVRPGFLPYGRQSIDEDDIAAVAQVLRGDWLTTGPEVARFEVDFAAAVDAPIAVVCNSGTAALHMAAHALGIGPGDLAIVPAVTFLASANAIRYLGGEVMFCDVDPDSGLMTPQALADALGRAAGRRVKAVIPVHLRGVTVDLKAIGDVAERIGAAIVEDACHALGTTYMANGRPHRVGACAHTEMACFSLHPVKTIAMGEGGVVTTRDPATADKLRRFRTHGMESNPERWTERDLGFEGDTPAPWYYEMREPGFNYRATDFACALGRSQLRKLDAFTLRRRQLTERYLKLLPALAPHVRAPITPADCDPALHLFSVRIDFAGLGLKRGAVMRGLRDRGIGTQVHYIPVNRQPYYRARYGSLELPGADRYYAETLSLPLFPGMADTDVERVVETLGSVLGLSV